MNGHTILEQTIDGRIPQGLGGNWYGVYPALVLDNQDPAGQGRVRISLPWAVDSEGEQYEAWARLAVLMAGSNRGSWFIPDVDDEVLIAFEGGNVARPYVVGMLWNGQDSPPEDIQSGNNIKSITSRNGVKIEFDDSDGQEKLTLQTPAGHSIKMEDPTTLKIEDANGNSITMNAGGVTIDTASTLTINASMIDMTASMVSVNAGMSRFSGVVQADTVISNSIVGASYTPGAGNIW